MFITTKYEYLYMCNIVVVLEKVANFLSDHIK